MIDPMLGAAVDVFRLRQYFNVITRTRELVEGLRDDGRLVAAAGRALPRLPLEPGPSRTSVDPFPPLVPRRSRALQGRRIGLVATGGSGSLASVVGVARAFEEAGIQPAVISLCSGSALFGFPIAAGLSASEVAAFSLSLRPQDYVDVSWSRLATLLPRAGRGFGGLVEGARIEATYRRLLGDRRLGDLPIPAYAPIWSVEHNRVDYVGPATHPDLPVARAVHMAIALPLFLQPVLYDGQHWCDGGVVDIFPVHPVLDIEQPCDGVVGVNGFYPPGFAGEDASGWERRRWSILYAASQVRTCQQIQLARENLKRLEEATRVAMIEPVPYSKVRGAGFYVQFLDNRDWAAFMAQGRVAGHQGLARLGRPRQRGARAGGSSAGRRHA
jgi:NTE family protein